MVSKGNSINNAVDVPVSPIAVNENPLKWCSVTLSDVIARGKRLEASVFDVEAKQARKIITGGKYPAVFVGGECGLASSYTGARFKRIWVERSNFPIYQPSTIMDIKPTPDGYISKLTKTDIEALRVKRGQVLMTCSGTIGKVAYVSKTMDNMIFSHDLLRINCYNPTDAGYLYTYFKSDIGNKILLTNSYGAVITHIEPEHLVTVPIPNAPMAIKRRIHDLIEQSYALRDESNGMLDEAQSLLIQELKLPAIADFDVSYFQKQAPVNTYSVKLSNMDGRIDASYHVPIVAAIVKHLREYASEVTTVGDKRISKGIILPGRFKRVYVDEGYGHVLFGGKQIHELDPSNKKYLSNSKHSERILRELLISENTTLITRSGTIGKVTMVPRHWENWVASEHIIRVVPACKEIAGYLNTFLSSEYGYQLITHFTYGSVVDEIDDNHVSQIPIPMLKNKAMQDRINALALEANQKRYEAYLLEQQAIEIMNSEVIHAQ